MVSKDSDKTQQKPVPPKPLSDLPPKDVSGEEGNVIKGGPMNPPNSPNVLNDVRKG
jgi:hypothetical protein